MCIRDSFLDLGRCERPQHEDRKDQREDDDFLEIAGIERGAVSYTHLRAHETVLDIVCRLLLEKKKQKTLNT